jgi:flagellar basal-body rod protein FlgF
MQSNTYVGLSAQISLQRRLETIANNVANATTAGFRAEEVKFETVLSRTSADPVAYVSSGQTYLSRKSGEFVRTDNLFDVAVQGDAWLAVQTAAGTTAYTRDGRLRMSETGELTSLNGQPILDAGATPIRLDPNAGPPRIGSDGTITQNKRQVAALGLFVIDQRANLTRVENAGVVPDRPATPALDFAKVGVHQGYTERSNVNPVLEMSKLIMVQRAFEAVTASLKDQDASQLEAIRTLGATS